MSNSSNGDNGYQGINPFEDFLLGASMDWKEDEMTYDADGILETSEIDVSDLLEQYEISCETVHPFVDRGIETAGEQLKGNPLSEFDEQALTCLSRTIGVIIAKQLTQVEGEYEDQFDEDDPEFVLTLENLLDFAYQVAFWTRVSFPIIKKLWNDKHEHND